MRTLITAHSGAENTRDNTLDSVRVQLNCGAEAIEIDVCTQGEHLVLSHDHPAEGTVCDALSDCFAEVARHPGIWVNVDLKAGDILARVADEAARQGIADRILFTGDVLSAADFAAARARSLPVWYNHTQVAPGTPYLDGAAQAGFEMLNINYRLVSDDMLSQAQRLSLWTVNEEDALRRFLAAGVKNITTRIPVLALQLRREIQG